MSSATQNLEKIEHIVVLMQENRSFDQMFGYLYHDSGNVSPTGQAFDGLTGKETNPLTQGSNTEEIQVFPIEETNPYSYVMPKADPGEGYPDTISQLYGYPANRDAPTNQGFVNNFAYAVKNVDSNWKPEDGVPPVYPNTQPQDIMGMFTPELLPVMSGLAKGYAVCDHWYCSIPTETLPNRAFIACGTSQGVLRDSNEETGKPFTYTAKTIFNVLYEKYKTWKIYGYDNFPLTPSGLLQLHQFESGKNQNNAYFGELADFKTDVADGNLADYVFLEPKFGALGNSMHPNYNVANGEQFIYEVYQTLINSDLWEKTLFIITFDEHGGTFDHVLPPKAVQPNYEAFNEQYDFKFEQYGVRVPTILVSPYIEAGSVFRAPTDGPPLSHCSVLSTLEAKFNLPYLTQRDKLAPHIGGALTLNNARNDDPLEGVVPPSYSPPQAPREHPGHLQLMHAHYCYCRWYEKKYGHNDDRWELPKFHSSEEVDAYIREKHREFASWN